MEEILQWIVIGLLAWRVILTELRWRVMVKFMRTVRGWITGQTGRIRAEVRAEADRRQRLGRGR